MVVHCMYLDENNNNSVPKPQWDIIKHLRFNILRLLLVGRIDCQLNCWWLTVAWYHVCFCVYKTVMLLILVTFGSVACPPSG